MPSARPIHRCTWNIARRSQTVCGWRTHFPQNPIWRDQCCTPRTVSARTGRYDEKAERRSGLSQPTPAQGFPVIRLLTATVALSLCLPAHAAAQIYAWRDNHGTLVLSDRAINAPTDVYTVERAPTYRTTRPLAPTSDAARYEPLVL